MTTQSEAVLIKLRTMLMRGDFSPGEHLQEIPLARRLEVSRTPVRLALGALAHEGLLVHKPQRGFLVRQFTVKEIIDAVDVRAELEAMACRIVAIRGLDEAGRFAIETLLADMERIGAADEISLAQCAEWFKLNGRYHDAMVAASGNGAIAKVVRQIDNVPLAPAWAVPATAQSSDRIKFIFARSQREHATILDALINRQSGRAEALMLEHVYQAREDLRAYLERLRGGQAVGAAPLLRLVAS